jgi:hypothetical protein
MRVYCLNLALDACILGAHGLAVWHLLGTGPLATGAAVAGALLLIVPGERSSQVRLLASLGR